VSQIEPNRRTRDWTNRTHQADRSRSTVLGDETATAAGSSSSRHRVGLDRPSPSGRAARPARAPQRHGAGRYSRAAAPLSESRGPPSPAVLRGPRAGAKPAAERQPWGGPRRGLAGTHRPDHRAATSRGPPLFPTAPSRPLGRRSRDADLLAARSTSSRSARSAPSFLVSRPQQSSSLAVLSPYARRPAAPALGGVEARVSHSLRRGLAISLLRGPVARPLPDDRWA
jgi:hypothetical protein